MILLRFTYAAIVLVTFLFISACGKDNSATLPVFAEETDSAKKNSTEIGVGYFPLNPLLDSDSAATLVARTATVAYFQRHWQESLNLHGRSFVDSLRSDIAAARHRGLKIYIALETLSTYRDSINLPQGLSGDFRAAEVRKEYLRTVEEAATAFQPDYFILNVEANMYRASNPEDYSAYRELYKTAYERVKILSPSTKVSVSLLYNDWNGRNCFDAEDLDTFTRDAREYAGFQDITAVSVYPYCYFDPDNIPIDFLERVATVSEKALFVSETAWPSTSFPINDSLAFSSDPETQARYIERLAEMSDFALGRSQAIEAVNYTALIDPNEETCAAIEEMLPALSYYCTLGLVDGAGNPKPAYYQMETWKQKLTAE
ncbi:MAG: hypothetical protein PHO83_04915 [Geobacteraceae bacterium]|nr:hypothetical protein [Geobacteraceae bacterium]